jgi:hypothetical protein
VLDSWGKFPSGLLSGDFQSLGAYWECANLGFEVARYCSISNPSFPTTQIQINITVPVLNSVHFNIPFIFTELGICVPSSCDDESLLAAISLPSSPVQFHSVNGALSATCDHDRKLSTNASSVVGLLIGLGVVGIVCSIIFESQKPTDQPPKPKHLEKTDVSVRYVLKCADSWFFSVSGATAIQ